ncbi:transmembrane protein 81 [Anolis sagrei]|uniref:transmembrane protein 81 n=1 Tax=Anolis sagrei TaxID=38937 RepID=UPI00352157E4
MTKAQVSLSLGTLLLTVFALLSMASNEPPSSPITIPKPLSDATARVAISSTSCSTTCGLGYKVEERCKITPNGERQQCSKRRVDCLSNWICGMVHYTVLVGESFEFSCLNTEEVGPETQSFSYTWRVARGIISTDDALFKPFKSSGFVINFSPVEEYDAGTYRCDVQFMKTYKIVKRIYVGIRVIPGHLVDLNFDKSLNEEQKLEIMNEGNEQNATAAPIEEQLKSWQQRAAFMFLIGIGSGALGGILLHTLLYYLLKAPADNEHVEE